LTNNNIDLTPALIPQNQYRIPPEFNGVQVNFCKNPECENFGIPAIQIANYKLQSSSKGQPSLHCLSCDEHIPVKSNQGISEEISRMIDGNTSIVECCPDSECSNHNISITTPKAYQSFGKTKSGSNRYRCKACMKTFAVSSVSTRYQKQPEITKQVFKLLMNKSPFRRICEVVDIHPETLYHRIDFLAEQCNSFMAHHEAKLKTLKIDRLYLAVDRQDYSINWTQRKDKRNNKFQGVATADNETRYVFGHHLNFDEALNTDEVESETASLNDLSKPLPYRRHARAWLKSDYQDAILRSIRRGYRPTLKDKIKGLYDDVANRDDVEKQEQLNKEIQLPTSGMQIHSEYTLYAHFNYIRSLLGNVGKVRFFLDQDSGMRAACLSAFNKEIKNRTCDAFFVKTSKELTVDEKRKCKNESRKVFNNFKKQHPHLKDSDIQLLMIKEELKRMQEIGKWKDKWLFHPLPDMSEPEKMVCYLTDLKDYDETHLAWLYNKASLHGVDTYFMQARRRISILERPLHSASSSGRVWNGYGAYNPNTIVKLLSLLRTFTNFILVGADKKTPAMRLGLADRPYTYDEVIEFI
jgi:transposase-like protein